MQSIFAAVLVLPAAVLLMLPSPVRASSSFRSRIPWGTQLSCNACHLPGGASANNLNSFGTAFLNNGSAYNTTLANLDSDHDGYTNGVELQDPAGAWRQGNANPGTSSLVTNPGDSASHPPISAVEDAFPAAPAASLRASPNPFHRSATLALNLPAVRDGEEYTVSIFTAAGAWVNSYALPRAAGALRGSVEWNGTDHAGAAVPAGIYFAVLSGPRYRLRATLVHSR